jgi:hypothetical protein
LATRPRYFASCEFSAARIAFSVFSDFGRVSLRIRSLCAVIQDGMQWHIQIRILVVIDGRIELNKDKGTFGLGFALEALEAEFAPYVRFKIDVAKHDGSLTPDALGGRTLRYPDFRFNDSDFDIDEYHQLWFFADQPSGQDGDDGFTTDDDIAAFALSEKEVRIVAEWMERGGGVFATGDHSILGASLCSRLPRVRTMRKWTHAQGVPSKSSADRHQTLQHGISEAEEADTLLQPVELVMRQIPGSGPFGQSTVPHPIFTTATLGDIDRFPDHMHEGEVIADSEVQLDLPPTFPDLLPEYPGTIHGVRPNPHVAAFGRTTNGRPVELQPALLPPYTDPGHLPLVYKRFGLVGTYDGNPVHIGRVVVDSTWHHWFSFNLTGIAVQAPTAFQKVQTYYRNVGLWLATPLQRLLMTVMAVWGNLIEAAPEEFSPNDSPWQIGQRLLARLRVSTSEAMIDEWLAAILDPAFAAVIRSRPGKPPSDPSWHALPPEVVRRALLGGIGSVLARLSRDYHNRRARGESPTPDADTVNACAAEGISRGHELIRQTIREAARSFAQMEAAMAAPGDPRPTDQGVRAR